MKYPYKIISNEKIIDSTSPHPLEGMKDKTFFIERLLKDLKIDSYEDISEGKKNLFRIYFNGLYYNIFIEFPDGGGKDISNNRTSKKISIPYGQKSFKKIINNYESIVVINIYFPLLKNKIIYCNCDNPKFSNFWKYFNDNFTKFKLRKLYATYFDKDQSFLYEKTNDGIKKTKLKGNGDFRNFECIEILKKSDIIVTNPPFSLLIPFFKILIESNKNFIFISSITIISNKYFVKEFKFNNLFGGINRINNFSSPNNEIKKVGAIWLTNFKIKRYPKRLLRLYFGSNNIFMQTRLYPIWNFLNYGSNIWW